MLALVVLIAAGTIGLGADALERKPFVLADVLRLLGTFGVLALAVERTLEVFISAWRGEVTSKLFVEAESARRRLEAAPSSFGAEQEHAQRARSLAEYRAATQRIALRCGVVLGLLIAAAGVRTLDLLVESPKNGTATILYTFLDVIITAGMIGGGSDAVHKLMSGVSGFLSTRRDERPPPVVPGAPTIPPSRPSGIPPVSAGQP